MSHRALSRLKEGDQKLCLGWKAGPSTKWLVFSNLMELWGKNLLAIDGDYRTP